MATAKLSVSRLINVAVTLTPQGAQAQSLNTMLLLATDNTVDTVERLREYTSLAGVAADFPTSAGAYKAAVHYFSQTPRPRKLLVGRWVRTASHGGLRCAPVAIGLQSVSGWTSFTSAGFTISVDGTPQALTGLNFSACTSMDAVAAVIQAAMTGCVVTWSESFKRFEFMANSTGPTSSVSFMTAPGSGTDISDELEGRSTDGGYVYAGASAEGAATVANFFDQYYGQRWYGLCVGFETDDNRLTFAATVEAMTNKHLYFTSTTDSATLVAANTTDVCSQLKALGYTRTFVQYTSYEQFSGGSYVQMSAAAKLLSVDYDANNTALTLMFKQEPGVPAELLNETQASALEGKNCNVFVAYDNETNILQHGTMINGEFADVVAGTDWLAVTCQTEAWNLLYTTPTKIPQTDAGVHLLVTAMEKVCSQGVRNGILAPGVWNSQGFGLLNQGDPLPKGYYVFADRVDNQLQNDRTARHAPSIQIAAKLAGAVHDVAIDMAVNQ